MESSATKPTTPLLTAALLASLAFATGCKDSAPPPPAEPEPWRHASTLAPYSIELTKDYVGFDPALIGNGADLTAEADARLFMIIPVEIPKIDGWETPALDVFKREGVRQLQRDVQGFSILTEQEIELDGHPAKMVIAEGTVNDQPSRYMVAYTQHAGWRYQIVAWSHTSRAAALTQDVDQMLKTWKFTGARDKKPVETGQ